MTLTQIANALGCDKGTEHHERHGYTEIYENRISLDARLLEIGIDSGLSVQMWKTWSPNIQLIAIDNRPECITKTVSELCDARECDQGNREQLALLAESIGDNALDVIIDDGSHRPDDQLLSIDMLFPCLKSGGRYFVEDLHTSNWFPVNTRSPYRLKRFATVTGSGLSFFCNRKLAMLVKP